MATPSKTKRSTPKLSDVARHVVAPKGAVSTSWPSVEQKCRDLGILFDGWQHGAGRLILAKRADGKYAATIGGTALSIPRQVGKTFLVGAIVFALCLLHPGLTVIWTAHRLRTAGETFDKMQGMTRRKKIRPHILKVVLGSGEEEVRFRNGSRILFGARERGFGRGFDEVDVLIFDEAQILTENAIDDMVPAMNQSRQSAGGLMLFMGTPPKPTDPGEVFMRMRTEALSGEDEDTGYIEFSADPKFVPSVSPAPMTAADWKQIAKANPSHPKRTPRESILRMRKKLTPDSMRREGFGIWDELVASMSPIPSAIWKDRFADEPPAQDAAPGALGVDRWYDGTTSVAAAWRKGESTHVELVAVDVVSTSGGVVDWLVERAGRKIPVLIVADSPAASLAADLRGRKVRVRLVSVADYARACGGFVDDALEDRLTHSNQKQLTTSVAAGRQKFGKAGAWSWDRAQQDSDITGLVAATLARFAAVETKPRTNRVVTA